ncbi:MAG: GAF domain-containing protein [Chloroflexi bacterium]|nr:GAF domain-containing protein [Chloroflexota bacterium]
MPLAIGSIPRRLCDIAQTLQSGEDAEERIAQFLRQLKGIVRHDTCAILYGWPGERLTFVSIPSNVEKPTVEITLRRLRDDLLDASRRRPGSVEPTGALPWPSYLVAPLMAQDEAIGILAVGRSTADTFGEEDLSLLSVVAAHLASYLSTLHGRAQLLKTGRARDDALAELRRVQDEREKLLSAIVHDLKNPLTAIQMYTEFLELGDRHVSASGEPQLSSTVAKIRTAVARMREQLDHVLDSALHDLHQPLHLRLEPTDLVALVRDLVGAHPRVVIETEKPRLLGRCDCGQLRRAVENLITNALTYSPEDRPVRVVLSVDTSTDGGTAVLEVHDRGVGIPAGDLPRIFTHFYRGQNVEGRFPGSGIGLASVQQIIQQHGGTVEASSVEGEGSVFSIRLPLGAS